MPKKRPQAMPASPGQLLREKRIANGWSRADVAWALCLAERQMRALERDDYANLPGKTYILGYWHNYASLLGISIDRAIAAHKPRLPQRRARITLPAEPRRAHGVLEQSRRRWALIFAAVAAVFLASLWVWQRPDDGYFPQWGAELQWRQWPALGQNGRDNSPPPALAQAWNGRGDAPAAESTAVLPEPNFPGEEAAAPAEEAVAATAAPSPENPAPAGAQTPPPPEQITVAAREESWVEVRDGDGRRLLYRTVAGGQRLTVSGALPFSVFLGNPDGVSVEYRGRPVAFTADRGRFARFSVGAP